MRTATNAIVESEHTERLSRQLAPPIECGSGGLPGNYKGEWWTLVDGKWSKTMNKELLTHSRQNSFKTCRKQHFYSYELGLRRIDDAKALRQGSAFHNGIEQLGKYNNLELACDAVRNSYRRCPEQFDQYEWNIERETVLRIVCAYQWRWESQDLEYIEVERQFELPLTNPATGKRTTSFNLAGKIDAIVKLDGRLAVKESKLLGDDIGIDSPLWRRLRIDHQISLYMLAARKLGFPVETVLYDVARKPTIQPSAVPVLDELGAKIVLSENGVRVKTERGQWRQTGDKEKGYTLQTRQMTVEEWGEKLTADICERPDFYFGRVEVPRLDQDLSEYEAELWEIQLAIREAQKSGSWYRTVNKNTCGYCPYFDICTSGQKLNGIPPAGFEYVSNKNPELNLGAEEPAVDAPNNTESYW